MRNSKSSQLMKRTRKNKNITQQQLAIDMFQSREYISKQEGGERKLPPVSTKYFIEKYNNPWLALEAVNEYIGWGLTPLDGPSAKNDKYFLQIELEKELKEAIKNISQLKLTNDLYSIHSMEIQDVHKSADAIVRVVHFSTLYLATLCEAYNISWLKVWEDHHANLKSKGYLI
ncbi:helix-turn-helix domain-containing protein [Halobacillus sp. A1]|uniref:helix-turn-helix domain-containing protein n=1 Tax=Halobacillus sp. A1 TaxID=2880262 RepID=UPI0020A6A33A|nr:helix-turn-helix domain-containing protein [Halobacillus sp. A1]MCP3032599.1 helix-turn-helix domain-containing protein [Halobacillus sp. A1]